MHSCLALMLSILLCTPAFAQRPATPDAVPITSEAEQRQALEESAYQLLQTENFDEVQRRMDEYADPRQRLASGVWKLYFFGRGIERFVSDNTLPATRESEATRIHERVES